MLGLFTGEKLAAYGFGQDHPFGPDRHDVFVDELRRLNLHNHPNLVNYPPSLASADILSCFHSRSYIKKVIDQSKSGLGFLDGGDTPAYPGIFESASTVVGTVISAVEKILIEEINTAFIPIAGLHHARRNTAGGFCVFNDIGVVIETLRNKYDINRIAYIDIDAHHGDGVFYEFIDDSDLCFVDFHEDGKFLYPGTGSADETGNGEAKGTKLNIPMPPTANDDVFKQFWPQAEEFIHKSKPEFIIFQCGADSIAGDPITHLCYTTATHAFVTRRLNIIANRYCSGRILALGGGGYNRSNLASAWCAVVNELLKS